MKQVSKTLVLAGAWVALAQIGCSDGPPCHQDPLGCGEGEEFAFEPSCELTGDLDVVLGEGAIDFVPYQGGEEPLVHEGRQGASHLCLGLEVADPALEYPKLKVDFAAQINDPSRCDPEDTACDPWIFTGRRDLVLGPELPLTEDGKVQAAGFIVTISIWPTDLERRVRMTAVDPCGREGVVDHLIPPSL